MVKMTPEQIKKLNDRQTEGRYHPFTCPHDGDAAHIAHEFAKEHTGENYEAYLEKEKAGGIPFPHAEFHQTNLIATAEGWVCPVCSYTQKFSSFEQEITE